MLPFLRFFLVSQEQSYVSAVTISRRGIMAQVWKTRNLENGKYVLLL
jgi:hypothetical protein